MISLYAVAKSDSLSNFHATLAEAVEEYHCEAPWSINWPCAIEEWTARPDGTRDQLVAHHVVESPGVTA